MKQTKSTVRLPRNVYEYSVNYYVYHDVKKNKFYQIEKEKITSFNAMSNKLMLSITLGILTYMLTSENIIISLAVTALAYIAFFFIHRKMLKGLKELDTFVIPSSSIPDAKNKAKLVSILYFVMSILLIAYAITDASLIETEKYVMLGLAVVALFSSIKTFIYANKLA